LEFDTRIGSLPSFGQNVIVEAGIAGVCDNGLISEVSTSAGFQTCGSCTDFTCNTRACDSATNQCVATPVPDGTPCPDIDGNACTVAGCEGGTCVQGHGNIACDTDQCNLGCNPVTGQCLPTQSSTPCTPANPVECKIAGCELDAANPTHASCVPTHANATDGTSCTDTDNNTCTIPGCEAGVCVQDHLVQQCVGDGCTCTTTTTTTIPADTTPPSVPTGVSATAASCSQINLAWNASTDAGGSGVKGYNVYRGGVFLKQVPGFSTSDTGLAGSTLYSYSIAAVDNAGNESAKSVIVSTPTPACPPTTTTTSTTATTTTTTLRVYAPGPPIREPNFLSPSGARFGQSIATSGTRVLVGAPNTNSVGGNVPGAAYVFETIASPGGPPFRLLYELLNPEPGPGASDFGRSVGFLGSDFVIGARGNDDGLGVVYIFSGTTGERINTIRNPEPSEPNSDLGFGYSLATSGNRLLVGAPINGARYASGVVYLYEYSHTDNTVTKLLDIPNPRPRRGGQFGKTPPAFFGSDIVVGAPDDDLVYVFDDGGLTKQTIPNPESTPIRFGAAVGTFGDGILVGAPDDGGGMGGGAVYLFDPTNSIAQWVFFNPDPPPPLSDSSFGTAIATVGSSVVVGDSRVFCDPPCGPGIAYVLDGAMGDLRGTLNDPEGGATDGFGISLSAFGSQIVVGANGVRGDGAAYLVDPSTGSLAQAFQRPRGGSNFAASVAALMDTVVLGAPNGFGSGVVLRGLADNLARIPDPQPARGDRFGASAAVDGTGDRLIVGAPGADARGAPNAGAAYLFQLSTGSLYATFQKTQPAEGDGFGTSVAFLGSDVVVGAPYDDGGIENAGAVYLFDGTVTDGTSHSPSRMFQSSPMVRGAFFGAAVSALGTNILVGAPFDAAGLGKAYLIDSGNGDVIRTFDNPDQSSSTSSLFGSAIAGIGTQFVVVGAPLADVEAGAAYVFDGSGAPLGGLHDPSPPPATGGQFGFALAPVGSYVLIGAPLADRQGAVDTGAAFLFDPANRNLVSILENPQQHPRDHFGMALSAVDAERVIIGAPGSPAAYIFTPCDDCPLTQPGGAVGRAAGAMSEDALACPAGYCIDGNPCTTGQCDSVKGCTQVVNPECKENPCYYGSLGCSDHQECEDAEQCPLCLGCDVLNAWPCCNMGANCVAGAPLTGTPCAEGNGMCNDGTCVPVVTPTCSCNRRNACFDAHCDASGACVQTPKTGIDAVRCALDRAKEDLPPECTETPPPPGIRSPFSSAEALAAKAQKAGAKNHPKREKQLLRSAVALFDQAETVAARLATCKHQRKKFSCECASQFQMILHDAGAAAQQLLNDLTSGASQRAAALRSGGDAGSTTTGAWYSSR
jgi:hypothetical protein